MALLIGFEPGGLDPKVVSVLDDLIAAIQTWAGKIDGLNAAERLTELTNGIASLPTVPTGAILEWPDSVAPTGYLFCNGAEVSRTTYVKLFAVVGTAYGVGNGSTTFNVPDHRGRFALGKAASGTGSTLAGTGGSLDHTHSGGTVSGSTANESSHTHSVSGDTSTETGNATYVTTGASVGSPAHLHTFSVTSGAGSAHGHGAGTLAVGTSGSANPAFIAVNFIIKT